MPGAELRIIFTGRLAEGVDRGAVLKNLCTLFKTEPEKIKLVFTGKGAVVWKGSDQALAARLTAALEKAGALCQIEESTDLRPPAIPQSSDAIQHVKEDAGKQSRIPVGIELRLGSLDISLTPVTCYRISAMPDGLGTGRHDCSQVGYDEIFLASAFKSSDQKEDYRLLLFSVCQKRPLIVDCNAIAYNEFSGATDIGMISSLRNFLKYLHTMHPGLVFDRDTCSFIDGAPPPLFTKDVTMLATALYKAREMPDASLPCKPPCPVASAASGMNAACAPVVPLYVSDMNNSPVKEMDDWSARLSFIFSLLLLAGFAWPLLKSSIVFGSDQFIWPWQFMGIGLDAEKLAGMATISSGARMLPWALVPLGTAILTLAIRSRLAGNRRFLGFLVVGAVSTTLLLAVFFKEAELYGLIMVPPTLAGGIMVLLTVACGGLIAATNHIRKTLPAGRLLRPLSVAGGTMVLLATLVAILGSDWRGWGIYPLYCLMLLVGTLGVANGLKAAPDESSLNLTSMALRGLLAWVPVAAVVTQSGSDSAFVQYVISAGGGVVNLAMSALKCFAIYYGCAFLMVLGLTGTLAALLLPPSSPAGRHHQSIP